MKNQAAVQLLGIISAIPNLDGIVGARQAGALLPEQNKSSSGLPRPYTKVIFGITG
jgi:hypothetical protein